MHRDSVGAADESVDAEDYQEACERIMARLERLREREEDAAPLLREADGSTAG